MGYEFYVLEISKQVSETLADCLRFSCIYTEPVFCLRSGYYVSAGFRFSQKDSYNALNAKNSQRERLLNLEKKNLSISGLMLCCCTKVLMQGCWCFHWHAPCEESCQRKITDFPTSAQCEFDICATLQGKSLCPYANWDPPQKFIARMHLWRFDGNYHYQEG